MKLIKLELKRTDFKGYLLAAAGIFVFCLDHDLCVSAASKAGGGERDKR